MREERLVFGEVTIVIRVSAEDSGGAMTVVEEIPPMVDTPLHVHSREDELFYILEGEHIVQRGDQAFRLGPGEAIFCPRGVPHAQRRVGAWLRARARGPHARRVRAVLPRPRRGRPRPRARAGRLRGRLGASRHHLALTALLR